MLNSRENWFDYGGGMGKYDPVRYASSIGWIVPQYQNIIEASPTLRCFLQGCTLGKISVL